MYEWRNKIIIITGAANGIGKCIVRLAIKEGAKHVAILDVDTTAGEALERELNSKYGDGMTRYYHCDVTYDDQLLAAFHSVAEEQGNIDVVINNAGIMNDSPHIYQKEIAINVTAVITSTLKAIEMMRVDEGGRGGTVVNISSSAGFRQKSVLPIYRGTKAAVTHFSSCIGGPDYFTKTGVRILTVCFGGTATTLFAPSKIGSHDRNIPPDMIYTLLSKENLQTIESAAVGVVAAYKFGASGSTWLVTDNLPARDITDKIAQIQQYEIIQAPEEKCVLDPLSTFTLAEDGLNIICTKLTKEK